MKKLKNNTILILLATIALVFSAIILSFQLIKKPRLPEEFSITETPCRFIFTPQLRSNPSPSPNPNLSP